MGNCQNGKNCYLGISDEWLRKAEEGLFRYAGIRPDQVKIKNLDINKKLAEVQKEYYNKFDEFIK